MTVLAATEWLQLLTLAGLSGAIGQSARVVIGLKKVSDEAASTNQTMKEMVEFSKIFVSLLIGFVAGVLALLAIGPDGITIDQGQILAFAAAGYAGADFIEGVMSRFVPSAEQTSGKKTNTAQTASTTGDDYLG
jgi:hypothetical protein